MGTHSSTLAWKIPWAEEPGGLQSMGSLGVGQDWATSFSLSLSLSCIGEWNGNPLQCSYLENPRDRGTWWAAVYGVAQNWTRLKRFSSSSSSSSRTLHGLKCVCSYPVTPWTVASRAPPSMWFSRQEYWSGLLFTTPGDLPNPGIRLSLRISRIGSPILYH